jgi:hypothetical protein
LPPDRGRDGVGCLSRRRVSPSSDRRVEDKGSLGAQPALQKLENGQRPSIEELKAGIEALEVAIRWTPSGLRLTNLAMFELELATRLSPGDAQRAKLLERSESHLVEGLLQNPCDGNAWLRLAIVQGLPRLARPESRGAPDGFDRRRAQSSGALEHAS